MLSRVATSLYIVGRRLERADHLARILMVHRGLSLDRAVTTGPDFWARFLEQAGASPTGAVSMEEAILETVMGPPERSILGSVAEARHAAQSVRPSLSTEVYEQLNALHWRLQESRWNRELHTFLTSVQFGVHLQTGLIEDTMAHDDAWDFLRLGRWLERMSNVTRVVTRKAVDLAEFSDDAVEWAAVLKCCSSFEAYRWRYSTPVHPNGVIEFLVFDRQLTRSAAFCAREALESVRRIDGPGTQTRPQKAMGRVSALFDDTPVAEVVSDPVSLRARFTDLLLEVESALRTTYFHPSRLASPVPMFAGDLRGQRQQQQQRRST
jgi:uncharacterized alpha-E superfamily protein